MRAKGQILMVLAAALLLLVPREQAAAQADGGFGSYLQILTVQARTAGVSEATIASVMPTLSFDDRVVRLDRGQPGNPTSPIVPKYAPYRASHVDANRIQRGRAAYESLRPFLAKVERETGVPESIMVSIWGNETNYGLVKGNFDLANSLASLAYEGRRRELFASEFIATLKLMDRGIARSTLVGSWAGATGHPQFLPSMILKLARDGDGDGRVDVWNSEADALASIANYFRMSGWRAGERWGVSVHVPEGFNRAAYANRLNSPRCERVHNRHSRWMTVAEWRALGVSPTGATLSDDTMASLFEPDGPGTPAWLLTGNYDVILEYNCSNFYGLSVGLLSDAVSR